MLSDMNDGDRAAVMIVGCIAIVLIVIAGCITYYHLNAPPRPDIEVRVQEFCQSVR